MTSACRYLCGWLAGWLAQPRVLFRHDFLATGQLILHRGRPAYGIHEHKRLPFARHRSFLAYIVHRTSFIQIQKDVCCTYELPLPHTS
ncbi:hypothetical protein F5Y10DRAFT_247281 [Nemania abortiva]|nr:hypothetical protein F5Y10DRAFT_247281 [Nemania abortiva]